MVAKSKVFFLRTKTGGTVTISVPQKKEYVFEKIPLTLESAWSSGEVTFSKTINKPFNNKEAIIDLLKQYIGTSNLPEAKEVQRFAENIVDYTNAAIEEKEITFESLHDDIDLGKTTTQASAPAPFVEEKETIFTIKKESRVKPIISKETSEMVTAIKEQEKRAEKRKRREEKAAQKQKDREIAPFYKYHRDALEEMDGVVFASKKGGQNSYLLKNSLHQRKLIGITGQVQFALGIQYSGGSQERMERGSRIHAYVDKALKSGNDVEIDRARLTKALSIQKTRKKKAWESQVSSARLEINEVLDEGVKAQQTVDYIRTKYRSSDGWKVKTEYVVSDYKAYASSVDILLVNDKTKEVVIIDLKTGRENIPYVSAQTSVYASFLQKHDRNNYKDYTIKLGVIGFDNKTGAIVPKELNRLSEKEVNNILYPTKDNSKFGFFYPQPVINKVEDSVFNVQNKVLPFSSENLKGVFKSEKELLKEPHEAKEFVKSKIANTGNVVFFDLETMPLANGKTTIRSVSLLNMRQYRDKEGRISFAYNRRSIFEKAFLSGEAVNPTSNLSYNQLSALETHKLTDANVIAFEEAYGRKARTATSKDVLDVLKRMKGKTVIGHNIINYDFGVLYYAGLESAYKEGGEKAAKKFIYNFNDTISKVSIIDTYDLAEIVQEHHESVLPSLTNKDLLRFFSPQTYEKLGKMLHQSSTDVVATAKNFEALLMEMSTAERAALFKIIERTSKNRFGYTVYRDSQQWEEGSEKLHDFRFSLNRSNPYLFGNQYEISQTGRKSPRRVKYSDAKENRQRELEDSINHRFPYVVTIRREKLGGEDRLVFDMPLYDAAVNIAAQEYIEKMKQGGFFAYNEEDIVSYYTNRQVRDSMVISDLGDFAMGVGKIEFEHQGLMYADLLQEAQKTVASTVTAILTRAAEGADITKLISNMMKHVTPEQAAFLATDKKFIPSISGNNKDVADAVLAALKAKAGATPTQFADYFRKAILTKGLVSNPDAYTNPDAPFLKEWLPSRNEKQLMSLYTRVGAYSKYLDDYSKIYPGFAEYAKENDFAEKMIFKHQIPLSSFAKYFYHLKSVGEATNFGAIPKEETPQILSSFFSSKFPENIKTAWSQTKDFSDLINTGTVEQKKAFTSLLSNQVGMLNSMLKGLGVSKETKQSTYNSILGNFFSDFYAGKLYNPSFNELLDFTKQAQEKDTMLKSAQKVMAEYKYDVAAPSRMSKENEKTIHALLLKQGMSKLNDILNGTAESANKLTDSLKGVQEGFDGLSREEKRLFGAAFHTPFYNPERFFGTAYSQIGGIHSSLTGLIPNFMNTSITKMLTGTIQDYEQEWLSAKYGLKKADTLMPILGAVLGAGIGGPNPMSIAVGASLGKGAAAVASQFIGLGREENVEAAGLFFQSRFNKMGAMLTAVTGALSLFAKALKIATVPILGGVGLGVYHYKRALANMSKFETPLTNLTGISYGNYYQDFERSDLAYGMAKGTTNKIIEGIEFQKQGLFTLGRYDKDKLISAAMLGVLNNAFIPNGRNGASNYASMMNTLYSRMSGASEAEQQRMMYLLNLYNPDMARQIQVRTDMTNFLSKQGAGSIYKRRANYFDITDDQRQEFRAVSFFQGNFADSINKSIMKVALGLYKWKGFGFMNELTGVIGRAGDYFAAGKYNEGLGEIADGIIRLMKGIGDTWKEVKEKLGVSSISDDIINRAKLIGYKLELVLLDIGDYALGIIDKVQGPLGDLGTMLMKQFSKLFEFVGTLRFDYDLKKLAKGQAGGITAHWGYKTSDYDATGDSSIAALFGQYHSVEDFYWAMQQVPEGQKRTFASLSDVDKAAVRKDYDLRMNKYLDTINWGTSSGFLNTSDSSILKSLLKDSSPEAEVARWRIAKLIQTINDTGFSGSLEDFLTQPLFLINGDRDLFKAWQKMFGYTSREVQNVIDVSSYTSLIGRGLDIVRTGIAEEKANVQGKHDTLVISINDGVKERNVATVKGEHIQLQKAVEYGFAIPNQF